MRVLIDRDAAKAALGRLKPFLGRDILSAAVLDAAGGRVRLLATDTQLAIRLEVEANVEAAGRVLVDPSRLGQLIGSLSGSGVELATVKRGLRVSAGGSTYEIPLRELDDYPPLPEVGPLRSTQTCQAADLTGALALVERAASPDDVRYGLHGYHVEPCEGGLRLVATDGHRLTWAELPAEGECGRAPRTLLPYRTPAALRGLDGDATIEWGEGSVQVSAGAASVWLRLVEGEFPDYQAILPRSTSDLSFEMESAALLSAMKRADLVSVRSDQRGNMTPTRLAVGRDGVTVSSGAIDLGQLIDELPADVSGEPLDIGVSAALVRDALTSHSGRTRVEIRGALMPVLIRDLTTERALWVVMPMRLD